MIPFNFSMNRLAPEKFPVFLKMIITFKISHNFQKTKKLKDKLKQKRIHNFYLKLSPPLLSSIILLINKYSFKYNLLYVASPLRKFSLNLGLLKNFPILLVKNLKFRISGPCPDIDLPSAPLTNTRHLKLKTGIISEKDSFLS